MPAAAASFTALWPEVQIMDLMEGSLALDMKNDGTLTPAMVKRFELLGDYCAAAGATAILFTCSAFGEAIERVKLQHEIPVLTPNEALFEELFARGGKMALLSTFEPTIIALKQELGQMEAKRGVKLDLDYHLIPDALDAVFAGDQHTHDRLVLEKVRALSAPTSEYSALVFGQFTMSMVAAQARAISALPILTTPDCAVMKLKKLLT